MTVKELREMVTCLPEGIEQEEFDNMQVSVVGVSEEGLTFEPAIEDLSGVSVFFDEREDEDTNVRMFLICGPSFEALVNVNGEDEQED